jgi:hypothetical protein
MGSMMVGAVVGAGAGVVDARLGSFVGFGTVQS